MAQPAAKKVMGQSVPNDEWVERTQEDIIEPELPIIDAHHHLWVRGGHRYLLPEFVDDVATGHNIVGTVFAECHSMYRKDGPEELKSLGETEFVTGCAAMGDSGTFGDTKYCQGFISNVDLMLGDQTKAIFEQHIERSAGRFKGIRYTTAWDKHDKIPSPSSTEHLLLDSNVLAGAKVMAELGLTLDCWVYHPQLDDVAQLAAAVPNLTIVLNHTGVPILGGPYREKHEEVHRDWLAGIKKVSANPNVFIKVGAFPIRKSGDGIDRSLPPTSIEIAEVWKPWMQECIEVFGPSRSIFESNFPVQKLFASYHVTWNAFKRIAVDASDDEKRWLFHDAAIAAYRL
jgi:L-fuconolactonase